jgi:nitroreductase/FMN reductase [NAD(P)H]
MATLKELTARRYGGLESFGGDTAATGTIAQLLGRRSNRRYRDDDVPDTLVDVLLACAQSAPTKSNLQQYSIVVISDRALRAALAPLCLRNKGIENAPLLVAFCSDMRRGQRICEFRAHPHRNNSIDTFHNAVVDAALVMGFFVAAAEAAGLGCAPLSSMRDEPEGVSKALGLPPGVFCIAGVMAGWPAAEGYVNQRLPQSIAVHRDRYDDSALARKIDDYDRARHAIFAQPPASQRHPDKYGYADPYYWSEGVARQLAEPERANFGPFLKRHGFDLS